MTGTIKDREALKNRYRKGMYPTESDFADVFESYVHKDDDIPMSKVVITDGDGNPTTLSGEIDKKADKTTLQTFIDETEAILQVVRNDNNQIASTAIDNLLSRIQDAEDDIDTAEDNISGHETRIATLESSKTDYEAFKERVRAFMEDTDASDATINRWHEIETFLQGITDTETLTGLLNDLKNEILAAIPSPQSGNFIEYTTDLDAITDAPNGKIMQYWGQSNDKYKRGQFYERVEKEIQSNHFSLVLNGTLTPEIDMSDRIFLKTDKIYKYHLLYSYVVCTGGERMPAVGDTVIDWNANTVTTIVSIENNFVQFADGRSCPLQNQIVSLPIFENTEGKEILSKQGYAEDSFMNNPRTYTDTDICKFMLINGDSIIAFQSESVRVGSAMGLSYKEWQHIHVDEVID